MFHNYDIMNDELFDEFLRQQFTTIRPAETQKDPPTFIEWFCEEFPKAQASLGIK